MTESHTGPAAIGLDEGMLAHLVSAATAPTLARRIYAADGLGQAGRR